MQSPSANQPQQILCPRCHLASRRSARYCQHCGHDMVLNNAGPRYYITRVVKAGGQGAVYETIGDDGRVYAVKEMLDRFNTAAERADAIERFEAEARMLERLSHPRIPRVYAHFEDEGRHYLSMDFVRGEDLEDVIEREGAIAETRVLAWAEQICDVLAYLHDNGLIYRDMKPSNVMLDHQHGGVKLVDFGIAKVLQPAVRGTQIGTPGYAPPEQYQGIATRESDIYALGATLHHLLTGRDPQAHPPFSFPPVRSLKPTVSQRTSDAIERALQMRPEDRFRSVVDFRAALFPTARQSLQQQPVVPPPRSSSTARPRRAAARQPAPAQPAPAQPAPAQPARPQAQPSAAARPAAQPAQATPQSTPPAQPSPAGVPAAQPPASKAAPARRPKRGARAWLLMLVGIVVVAGMFVTAFPDVVDSLRSSISSEPTPQTLVDQEYTARDLEIIVPESSGEATLQRGFTAAFSQSARATFGPGVQVREETLTYIDGPTRIGVDSQGARYRATMTGRIMVPQEP